MTHEEKLKPAHGNWVDGDRFWDRELDIRLFIECVDEGAHQLVVAQRRMGKTSLIREVGRRLADRYTVIFLDLQKAHDAQEAIVELSLAMQPHADLWTKTLKLFENTFKALGSAVEKLNVGELGVTLRAGLNAGNWAEKGDKLLDVLASAEKPALLLFDEVPILVNRILKGHDFQVTAGGRMATDEFMSWIRDNSIRHQGKIRIVLTGSIGLEPILRQARLSATLNTFRPFDLGPWEDAAAHGCLKALGNEKGIIFQEDTQEEMIRLLGLNIPHHVQMFFDRVYERCFRRQDMVVSLTDVGVVFNQSMLSIRGHAELAHYEDRLEMVLGRALFPLALEMLTEAAVKGVLSDEALVALRAEYSFEGRSPTSAQKEILSVLLHDGYLSESAGNLKFASKLLRDWWKARHGHAYIPVLERPTP